MDSDIAMSLQIGLKYTQAYLMIAMTRSYCSQAEIPVNTRIDWYDGYQPKRQKANPVFHFADESILELGHHAYGTYTPPAQGQYNERRLSLA